MALLKFIFKILGALSPVHIWFVTIMTGAKKIGTDSLGNIYYEAKARKGYTHPRRWVMYSGEAEPSTVPPEWHGWLHYQTNAIPAEGTSSYRRPWQKSAQANLTGTTAAYHPPGHLLAGNQRDKATGDYEAWTPPQAAAGVKSHIA
ncbi:MAG: NADH:ubiquinone oxidoreductase subunit NDUFA12 [Pseudobdellovibrionaceae bacterium]